MHGPRMMVVWRVAVEGRRRNRRAACVVEQENSADRCQSQTEFHLPRMAYPGSRRQPTKRLADLSPALHISAMAEQLKMRIYGDAALPTLIYVPGLHGDCALVGSFRRAVSGKVGFVEMTYPRTLA